MPNNDIEEFLKRAAQRRQTKPAQVPPPPAVPRSEYTDAKLERIPRNREDDAPVQAILIEEESAGESAGESVAAHMKGLSKQRAQSVRKENERRAGGTVKPVEPPVIGKLSDSAYVPQTRAPSIAPQTVLGDDSGFTVADRLVTMLQKPEGMMQAMLLQEILKRPEDRW